MIEVIVQVVGEVICGLTGHAVLMVVTFGRWRASEKTDGIAIVVGILFWILIGVGIWFFFFRK
jgi:hypothetical protein